MKRVRTSFALASLTVLFSVLLALISAEVAFRVYLSSRLDLPSAGSYQAVNAPTGVFSEAHGYDYVPSRSFTMATIQEGKVVMCNRIVSNSDRNLGRETHLPRGSDPTILVVGDSFSDNAHLGGITWPDLMTDQLSSDLGQAVSVLNYSRSGYGVPQMFAMAAAQVENSHSRLLLIPFILDDVARPRFWRTSREKDGEIRFFQSARATLRPSLAESFDVSLVDDDINETWCRSALNHPFAEDPILARLNDRYRRLAIESDRVIRLVSISESLLYKRIVERDLSLKRVRPVFFLPKYEFESYAEDPLFVADLKRVQDVGVPIQLIRLPLYEELVQGAYHEGSAQEQSLLHSLEQLTGSQVTPLLPANDLAGDLASLFLLPHDSHPSVEGAAFYAREVSQRIALQHLVLAPTAQRADVPIQPGITTLTSVGPSPGRSDRFGIEVTP